MSHPDDWTEMRACVRLTREIFAQPAFEPYRGREIQPGADVVTDEAIDAFVRDKVESAYHPSCTCRMGARDDPAAVVDRERASSASRGCGSSTPRSCRRSPPATSTRRPS